MHEKVQVQQGDITKLSVDAIVNAANSSLMGGGGVDGAIHRAGGPSILEACKEIVAQTGGCPTGEAVITTAGNLPATYVIHTVGPVWEDKPQDQEQLRNCYRNSMNLALEHGCKSLAFPNISTGVYGFPKDKAAKIAVSTVLNVLQHSQGLDKVVLCCFDRENYSLCQQELIKHTRKTRL